MLARDKISSLLRTFVNYGCKKFHNIEPRSGAAWTQRDRGHGLLQSRCRQRSHSAGCSVLGSPAGASGSGRHEFESAAGVHDQPCPTADPDPVCGWKFGKHPIFILTFLRLGRYFVFQSDFLTARWDYQFRVVAFITFFHE
jgi:hypothetical protein